MPTISNAP